MKAGVHPASGGWGNLKEARTKRMGCLLGSGFLKPGAVCSLTIWKKLSDHLRCKDGWHGCGRLAALERLWLRLRVCGREVVRGFRLYVSPIAIEFDGEGSNTSAEVDLELGVFESNLEGSKL